MVDWATAQRGIFAGESGGDYSALFNYQNRPGGLFENTDVAKMTIGQLKDFTNPGGDYGRYVKRTNPEGVLSTPIGAYQVVGRTLKDAVKALNISDDQVFNQATQDKIGRWIFDTQGTGAWEGYKAQTAPLAAPGMFNQSPQGRNAPMQQNAGGGLLANLGLQKMQPGAAGETGQKFYERDSFKDFSGVMANWLNSQTVNPDPNMSKAIADIRNQRTEKKRRNKTVEYLRKAGMDDIADMADAGGIGGQELMSAIIQQRMATPKTPNRIQLIEHFISKFGMTREEAIKASGSNGINIGATENEYDKRMGGSFADKEIAINKASTNATETLTTVRMMKDIAMQPNFETGSGSDGLLQANKFFSRLFGSSTDVSDNETFKSLSNQLILKNLGGSLGVGVSNADLAFIQTTVPTINNTKEGIKQMLNIQEKLAMRQIQIGQLAMKWRSENNGKMLTSEWDMYLNTWKEANPLFVNAS